MDALAAGGQAAVTAHNRQPARDDRWLLRPQASVPMPAGPQASSGSRACSSPAPPGPAAETDEEIARRLQREFDQLQASSGGGSGRACSSTAQPRPAAPPHPAAQLQTAAETDEELALRLQREFDHEVAEKEAAARFQCPLCLEHASFDKSVQLDCSHRLCHDCFYAYMEVKIREKRVTADELCCPMPDCTCEVTDLQVEGATKGTPLWDRFLSSRMELWKPGASADETVCQCPTPGCELRFLTPTQALEVRCPECRAVFCPRCGKRHPGVDCSAHAAAQRGSQADKEFDELMRKQCWQRCPCCQAVCERQYGCNYITCSSEVCRGKKAFCYLCGQELSMVEHYTHFPHGMFQNSCANVDRREEADLPQAKFFNPEGIGGWVAGLMNDVPWPFAGERASGEPAADQPGAQAGAPHGEPAGERRGERAGGPHGAPR